MAITGYRGPRLPSQPQGHEDAFPRPRLSARCRFSQGTFAGTRGNGRDAPIPAIRRQAANLSGSEPTRPCAAGLAGLQMPNGSPQVG